MTVPLEYNKYCIKVYYNDDSETARKSAEKGEEANSLEVDAVYGRY